MGNNLGRIPLSIRIINLSSLLFIIIGIVLIGSFIFLKTLELSLGKSVTDFNTIFESGIQSSKIRKSILIAQATTQILSFIGIPLVIILFIWKDLKEVLTLNRTKLGSLAFGATLIGLVCIPIIAAMSQLNKNLLEQLHFSESIQSWIIHSEKEAEKLTMMLAYYNDVPQMVVGLLVIAVLPAIGEELLFRGIIQKKFTKIFLNPHVAIFVTGFLFSFIHFQFFGFLPRMFLGVLFGYMYYWSKSLLIPIVMHFTNNALTYFAINLYKQKKITVDLESTKDIPISTFIFSVVIFLFLLVWFVKIAKENEIVKYWKNN